MVEIEAREDIAILRMTHGKVNALDLELVERLSGELEGIDASGARAVVLTGAGTTFSAGVDLFRVVRGGKPYIDRFMPALSRGLANLYRFPRPVVAAINGHAIAGGCLLALASDYRLMARGTARIGVPELAVGVPFPLIAVEILREMLPDRRLHEVVYGGQVYPTELARERGLVDELVASDELLSRAVEMAKKLASIPAESFGLTKKLLRGHALERWEREGPSADAQVTAVWSRPDVLEAIRTYLEKTFGRAD